MTKLFVRRSAPSSRPASERQWRLHVAAGERVAQLLDQLEHEIAGLQGGDGLVYLVRQLSEEIASSDSAAWHAIKALDTERHAAH